MAMNRSRHTDVPRGGAALLGGLISCGRCGRRMLTTYTDDGREVRYVCHQLATIYGEPRCQSISAWPVDRLTSKLIHGSVQSLDTSGGPRLLHLGQLMSDAQYRSDSRVTCGGRVLRNSSIDGRPQFFNVLLGQMSIVGPRSHALGLTADANCSGTSANIIEAAMCSNRGLPRLRRCGAHAARRKKMADLENRPGADLEYLRAWSLKREIAIVRRMFSVLVHENAF